MTYAVKKLKSNLQNPRSKSLMTPSPENLAELHEKMQRSKSLVTPSPEYLRKRRAFRKMFKMSFSTARTQMKSRLKLERLKISFLRRLNTRPKGLL